MRERERCEDLERPVEGGELTRDKSVFDQAK